MRGSDAFSVTTPSWGDEAQAESHHASTKTSIPHDAERLFTKPNLLIAGPAATSEIRGLMPKESHHDSCQHTQDSQRTLHTHQNQESARTLGGQQSAWTPG